MLPSDATKGRIPLSLRGEFLLPPLGDWKISPLLLRQELRRGLTLNRYMEPDAADTTPTGRQPNRPEKEIESAPIYVHSEIDSIVLNAPWRTFMPTALDSKNCRDSSRLCETCRKSMKRISHSLLYWTAKNKRPSCGSCSAFRSGELHGKQCQTIFRVVSFCSSRSPIERLRSR